MDTSQAAALGPEGKGLPVGGEALIQETAIASQGEVAGNMEMMVMDALDPTLLQMKTEVLEGGSTMTVTGGDEGQIITLQVSTVHTLKYCWIICNCSCYDHVKNTVLYRW